MKRLIINTFAFLIIAIGGLSLIPTNANANIKECSEGWELQCDDNHCCTVCQSNGEIGDCY